MTANAASPHLDETALEAAATDRDDLLSAAQLAHLDECEHCAAWVAHTQADVADASLALRRAMPEIDGLERMIATAMEAAPDPATLQRAPSRRSLWLGGAVGACLATALAIWSSPGASLSGVPALGRQGWTLFRASNNVVDATVPLGWAGVAVIGLLLSLMLFVPMRLLLGQRRVRVPGLSTLSGMIAVTVISVVSLTTGVARAYRVDGTWPTPEPRVTVDVTDQPTSEALRQAAASAELGIMMRLPDDPPVTLHVIDAPISEVMQALLGDADVVVRPSQHMLSVSVDPVPPPPATEAPATETPATPPRVEMPPVPHHAPRRPVVVALGPGVTPATHSPSTHDIPSPPAGISDRVSLGGDLVIGEDEDVRDVVTAGGDVDLRGRAFGNVVTAGGDAEIRGEVIGDVTSAGGDIEVFDDAIVHGNLNAMGGEINVHDDAQVYGQMVGINDDSEGRAAAARAADVSDDGTSVVRWALLNVLVFLLGLLMMGTSQQRLSTLRAELAARPIRSALGGVFGLPAGILLSVVLLLTIIGAPGAAILAAVLFCAFWVGWTTIAYWIGTALPIKALKDRPVMQLAAGVAAVFVVGLVPKIGTFLVFVGIMAGLGAVISTSFGKKDRTASRPNHASNRQLRSSLPPL